MELALRYMRAGLMVVALGSLVCGPVMSASANYNPSPGGGGDAPVPPEPEVVTVIEAPVRVIRNGRVIVVDCADPRLAWVCSRLVSGTFQPWWWDYYAEGYGFLESGAFDERNNTVDKGNCADLANDLITVGNITMGISALAIGGRAAYKWHKGEPITLADWLDDHFDVGAASPISWNPPPPAGFRSQRGILIPQSQWSRDLAKARGGRGRLDLAILITGGTGAAIMLTGVGIAMSCDFTPSDDE